MKLFKSTLVFISPVLFLLSCSGGGNKPTLTNQPRQGAEQTLDPDTNKIRSDVNDMVNSIISDKPDTNKLKDAAHDILSKGAGMLSDSGIDKLTGKDPSAKEAGDMLKKFRDATGLTPAALDSIKKAAASLDQ
jgi:hypothetical protein